MDPLHWMRRLDEGLITDSPLMGAFRVNLRDILFAADAATLQPIIALLRGKPENQGMDEGMLRAKAIDWGVEKGTLLRTIVAAEPLTRRCVLNCKLARWLAAC